MKTRAIQSAAVVAIVCWALASGASADCARAHELAQTDRSVAQCSDLSEATFAGLRVVFTSEVAPIQAIAIGGALDLMPNEAGVLAREGTILPFGMFKIDVDLPHSRMWYVAPPGPPRGTTNASRTFRSTSDPTGTSRRIPTLSPSFGTNGAGATGS